MSTNRKNLIKKLCKKVIDLNDIGPPEKKRSKWKDDNWFPMTGCALPADRYKEDKGGEIFFRGDDRSPQILFYKGFKKRDPRHRQPRMKNNHIANDIMRETSPDIVSASAVCMSRDFHSAAIFPGGDGKVLQKHSYMYIIDLEPRNLFNTQSYQWDYMVENKLLPKAGQIEEAVKVAWTMKDREWAANRVYGRRIVGAIRIERHFDHSRNNRAGGHFFVKEYYPNPIYLGRRAKEINKSMYGFIQNKDRVNLPTPNQGIVKGFAG